MILGQSSVTMIEVTSSLTDSDWALRLITHDPSVTKLARKQFDIYRRLSRGHSLYMQLLDTPQIIMNSMAIFK